MANAHMATYLNDHLAGSVAALELLGHLEQAHADTDVGRLLTGLRADIEVDRGHLEALMECQSVPTSKVRKTSAWIAEKLTQLKLRLDDPAGGPLRLLEVVEALSVGIEGKRLLWRSLIAAALSPPPGTDYERLVRRAEEQRQRVEAIRLDAAKAAFGAA